MISFRTDEELANSVFTKSYYWSSERSRECFMEDYYNTKNSLVELKVKMTPELYQGQVKNEEDELLVRQYNKLNNHYNKLMQRIRRMGSLRMMR